MFYEIIENPYKNKGGRPNQYKKEYCDGLINHMSQGLSYETYAGIIGVTRKTLYNWEKSHKDWRDAKEKAFELCQLFWEQVGVMGTLGAVIRNNKGELIDYSKVNSTMWIFNMKNRFNWKDRMDMTSDDEKFQGAVVVLPSNGREKNNN